MSESTLVESPEPQGTGSTFQPMRDMDVRTALHGQLEVEHAHERASTLLVDELGLCGAVRVDVAVVNGALSGFELKSASDTLKRLPVQVDYYSRVLDYATLVVAKNHVDAALQITPRWWGCYVASWDGSSVTLRKRRRPKLNPGIDPYSLAQLLWREESLEVLVRHNAARGVMSKPRTVLWERLAETLSLEVLRSEVRQALKARTSWRSAR